MLPVSERGGVEVECKHRGFEGHGLYSKGRASGVFILANTYNRSVYSPRLKLTEPL